jgi:cell wall-associated NlpC family hydrolase
VAADRFVEGIEYEVVASAAPLRREPSHQAPLDTEALRGERATIYDITEDGWAWGQLNSDGYVGWMPSEALIAPGASPTHKVSALRTFAFPGPSIKLAPADALSFGSRLVIARIEGPFAITARGEFVPAVHLAAAGSAVRDWVSVAEMFLNVPYLWGGKTSLGLDCSGLVQVAMAAAGKTCPRDSDLQETALDAALSHIEPDAVQRGDLMFWKGHVAIALDGERIIHANAAHMAVAIEPIATAIRRIQTSDGGALRCIRRPSPHPAVT